MTPLCSGDRIEVRDPAAKIVLRLINHATPVTVSQGNLDTPLTDAPPARSFWTPSIAWVASLTGRKAHEVFMPAILMLTLMQLFAMGSIAIWRGRFRKVAIVAFFLLDF